MSEGYGPLGKALAAWRRRERIDRAEAARRLGVSLGAYKAWEQGMNAPSRMGFLGLKSIDALHLPATLDWSDVHAAVVARKAQPVDQERRERAAMAYRKRRARGGKR